MPYGISRLPLLQIRCNSSPGMGEAASHRVLPYGRSPTHGWRTVAMYTRRCCRPDAVGHPRVGAPCLHLTHRVAPGVFRPAAREGWRSIRASMVPRSGPGWLCTRNVSSVSYCLTRIPRAHSTPDKMPSLTTAESARFKTGQAVALAARDAIATRDGRVAQIFDSVAAINCSATRPLRSAVAGRRMSHYSRLKTEDSDS